MAVPSGMIRMMNCLSMLHESNCAFFLGTLAPKKGSDVLVKGNHWLDESFMGDYSYVFIYLFKMMHFLLPQ